MNKLKLSEEKSWQCGLCRALLPALLPGSAEGQRTTAQKMACLLNSNIAGLVLTATLAKAVKKILSGESICDFLEEKLGKADLSELAVTSSPVRS